MKNSIIIWLLGATLGLASCSNWLTVEPKGIMEEEEMFSREMGFKEALAGVYLQMASGSLYGRELSYGFLDILGQCYQQKEGSGNFPYQERGYYQFPSATTESMTNSIWRNMYNVIANVNNLLYWTDRNRQVFATDGYYEIVKGEALALRAFLHFDLLRMFGPVYKENEDSYAIVYRTAFNRETKTLLPARTVVDSIVRDLKAAEEILAKKDPLNFEFPVTVNDEMAMGGDVFLTYRHKRMNLYAVKGLLARVYLYAGNKTEAAKYAKEVVESGYFDLVSDNSVDRVYSTEILFSIYVDKLDEQVQGDFSTRGGFYVSEPSFLSEHFSVAEDGANDIRYREGTAFATDAFGKYSLKYEQSGAWISIQNTIPLIRLSEMYYILAECEDDLSVSANYLSDVRSARGLDAVGYSADQKEAAITKEYRKEFYAEGQLFYYYKRLFKSTFLHCPVSPMNESNYRFSYPDDEVLFGDVPQNGI